MGTVARVAAVAIAIAAAVPTGGTSLLAAGVAAAGVASGAAAASVAAGIAIAANVGASLLAKKPKAAGNTNPTSWRADPGAAVPIGLGRSMLGGDIRYRKTHGGDSNPLQTLVTILSGAGPIEGLESATADKVVLTFDAAGAETGKFKGWMWERSQRGLCPEPAALVPPNGNPPGWTPDHRLSGYAAVITTLRYDAKGDGTFTTEPQRGWLGRWVWAYDPRKDDTYPGGMGPQRAGDPLSWAWSQCPPIIGLTWSLGWHQNGKRVAGAGLPIADIDVGSFVEAANIADFNGWTCGGMVTTGEDKWEVLKAILQAGGAEPVRDGATLSCVVNAPRVAIATITDADLVGTMRIQRTQRRKQRINGVMPVCRSEAHDWEEVPADVVREQSFVDQDHGERTREINYRLVQVGADGDTSQLVELAGYDIENAREAGPIEAPLKLRWIGYKAGDLLKCEIGESGIAGRELLVLRRRLDAATGSVTLVCRTEDPAKHARIFARTGSLPPTSEYVRPDRPGEIAFGVDQPLARASYIIRTIDSGPAYPATSSADTITVQAFTATIDDGRQIAFPEAVLGGLAGGTAYRLVYSLEGGTWSAVPLPATAATASPANVVLFYDLATQTADGTYPEQPTEPGGYLKQDMGR